MARKKAVIPEFRSKIAFRLKIEEREMIEQLLKEGKYKSLSSFIRAAIEEKLKNS